jgi:hypothetical protein
MRNGQNNNNKRMRNRNNGGGGGNNHNNNRRGQNPMTRVYESNGPEIKIRGTASHLAEKYVQLARDAQGSGDPVSAENYYQHAEHYFRIIAAAQEQFRQNSPVQRIDNDTRDDSGEDGDNEYSSFGAEPRFVPRDQPVYQPREAAQQPQPYQSREAQPFPPREQNTRDARPQQQPAPSQTSADIDRLPSFITGSQPQPGGGDVGAANGERNGGSERFPRRRRRHTGPRPEAAALQGATPGDESGPRGE